MSAHQLNFEQNLSPDSRIWFYQTNRELNESEIQSLSIELKEFMKTWAAHGSGLYGDFTFFNPFLLIVAVDDSKVPPSGCSIDAFVRFLTSLGAKYNIDFFVRMKTVALVDGQWKQLDFDEVALVKNDVQIVDTTVSSLHDFNLKGLVKPELSGLSPLFSN